MAAPLTILSLGAPLAAPPPNLQNWNPSIPSQFGPAANDIQAAAQQQLLIQEAHAQAQAKDAIGALASHAGVTQGDLIRVENAYSQYGAQAVASVLRIASGQQSMSFSAIAPFVGMALAIAGAAPVVGTVIAAALALMDVVANSVNDALRPSCGDPTHQWLLPGGMCITQGNGRPVGPDQIDPITGKTLGPLPLWVGWPAFESSFIATHDDIARGEVWQPWDGKRIWRDSGIVDTGPDINAAFPEYAETIGCEMDWLGPAPQIGEDTSVGGFFRTYYTALGHAREFAINGYNWADPWQVFWTTLLAWNASHAGPSVKLVATPRSQKRGVPRRQTHQCGSNGAPNDPNGFSFIGSLLNGDQDPTGQHHVDNIYPLNVGPSNAGPNISRIINLSPNAPASTSMSVPAKIAIAGAGVAGAGALAVAITAWVKKETFGHVLGSAYKSAKGALTGKKRRRRAR